MKLTEKAIDNFMTDVRHHVFSEVKLTEEIVQERCSFQLLWVLPLVFFPAVVSTLGVLFIVTMGIIGVWAANAIVAVISVLAIYGCVKMHRKFHIYKQQILSTKVSYNDQLFNTFEYFVTHTIHESNYKKPVNKDFVTVHVYFTMVAVALNYKMALINVEKMSRIT